MFEQLTSVQDTPFVIWQEVYSVGDPIMDAQHGELLRIINELFDAIRVSAGAQYIHNTLVSVKEYVEFHLISEENLLRNIQYPELDTHRRQHDEMRTWLREMCFEFRAGRSNISKDLLIFLRDWWIKHITRSDGLYAPYLSNQRGDSILKSL